MQIRVRIFSSGILHLVEEIPNVIKRMNELLKPGGLIVSTTPCFGEKRTLISTLLCLLIKFKILPYMSLFSIPELEGYITNGNNLAAENIRGHVLCGFENKSETTILE